MQVYVLEKKTVDFESRHNIMPLFEVSPIFSLLYFT